MNAEYSETQVVLSLRNQSGLPANYEPVHALETDRMLSPEEILIQSKRVKQEPVTGMGTHTKIIRVSR